MLSPCTVCGLQELDTGYRKLWDFGRNWDPDAYAAQPRSLAEIRKDLVVQRQFKLSLDRMKTNMTVGCLQVWIRACTQFGSQLCTASCVQSRQLHDLDMLQQPCL